MTVECRAAAGRHQGTVRKRWIVLNKELVLNLLLAKRECIYFGVLDYWGVIAHCAVHQAPVLFLVWLQTQLSVAQTPWHEWASSGLTHMLHDLKL